MIGWLDNNLSNKYIFISSNSYRTNYKLVKYVFYKVVNNLSHKLTVINDDGDLHQITKGTFYDYEMKFEEEYIGLHTPFKVLTSAYTIPLYGIYYLLDTSHSESFIQEQHLRFLKNYTFLDIKLHHNSAYSHNLERVLPNKHKYSIGDIVVITKSNKGWTNKMDKYNGRIVKITDIKFEGQTDEHIKFIDSNTYYFDKQKNHFRYAYKEEKEFYLSLTEKQQSSSFSSIYNIPNRYDPGDIAGVLQKYNNEIDNTNKVLFKPNNSNRLTYIQQQAVNVLLHNPKAYRKLLATCNNPGYVARFIRNLLPTRVGYEFDVLCKVKNQDEIHNFENQHLRVSMKGIRLPFYNFDLSSTKIYNESGGEIRFSFKTIAGLIYFKNFIDDINKTKIFQPDSEGGLHIHIDCIEKSDLSKHGIQDKLQEEYYKRSKKIRLYRNYIYKVFDIPSKDDSLGREIRRKEKFISGRDRKKICVGRSLPTVEWRLANTTFSYEKIMKLTIFCKLMTDTVKRQNKDFSKNLFEKILLGDK